MGDVPTLTIAPTQFWCAEHLEPFRERWPTGYLTATMYLLEQATEREDIQQAAHKKVEELSRVLTEFGPICCLVARQDGHGEEWLRDIIDRSIAMDPKLVLEIKARQSGRKIERINAERLAQKERSWRAKKP